MKAEARRCLFTAAPGAPSGPRRSARRWGRGESTAKASSRRAALLAVVLLMGCASPAAVRRVGGTVSGLQGTGLVLQNNGHSDLAVNADGAFAFEMTQGSRYSITVLTQPADPGQTCTVTDGEGVVGERAVTNVAVDCRLPGSVLVKGTVNGLVGTGLVLQNDGTGDLPLSRDDGAFAFNVAQGAHYSISVLTQPTVPAQSCAVTNGEGTASGGDVTDVEVACRLFSPRFAYVASGGQWTISIFAVNATTGALEFRDKVTDSHGAFSIAIDPSGKYAYTANSDGSAGSVSAYEINATTGALTELTRLGSPFPAGDHSWAIAVDPRGRFVYVANRGGDETATTAANVSAYRINEGGSLTQVEGSPFAAGVQPHSVTVDPSGRFVYVGNFGSDDISAYAIDDRGALTNRVDIPAGDGPNVVAIHPSGRFAYVSHWNTKDMGAYEVDPDSGVLSGIAGSVQVGANARFTAIDPWGRFAYVANHYDNTVSAFTIDVATGALGYVRNLPFDAGSCPISVTVDPSGTFAYVANYGPDPHADPDSISTYRIDASSGALEPIATTEVDNKPSSIAILQGLDPLP